MALHDDLLTLQAEVTKTADFAGAAFNIPHGVPRSRALYAKVLYEAAGDAAAAPTSSAQFNIEHSTDGGSTWKLLSSGADQVVTLDTAAVSGVVYLPVATDAAHIRLVLDVTAGDGSSTPTITYHAFLVTSKP